jgi:hypothetical protein
VFLVSIEDARSYLIQLRWSYELIDTPACLDEVEVDSFDDAALDSEVENDDEDIPQGYVSVHVTEPLFFTIPSESTSDNESNAESGEDYDSEMGQSAPSTQRVLVNGQNWVVWKERHPDGTSSIRIVRMCDMTKELWERPLYKSRTLTAGLRQGRPTRKGDYCFLTLEFALFDCELHEALV